jgi:hypothetical protein
MIKKLRLDPEELHIESFATVDRDCDRGTVQGYATEEWMCYSYACVTIACQTATCPPTPQCGGDITVTLRADCSGTCTERFSCLICEVNNN